jgi:23S rRNA pseudouridine2604 synthase
VRLNKRLSDLGHCSRREADEWIARGWVQVNGAVAQMGQTVTEADRIEVRPEAQAQQGERVTVLLHKPVGYVSGLPEDGHESAAVLIKPQTRWREDRVPRRFEATHTRGLAPAGRLDIDSTGLLVMTQDGRVAKALIGEHSGMEKEYLVRVQWAPHGPKGAGVVEQQVQAVFPPDRLALLRHGLQIDGQALKPAQVDWQNPEQLRFVLTEGKKRQIRRMCEQVGLHVVGLKRIRIGRIVLGNLPVGQWRYLQAHERF